MITREPTLPAFDRRVGIRAVHLELEALQVRHKSDPVLQVGDDESIYQ